MRLPWVSRARYEEKCLSREAWMREAAQRQERIDMAQHNLAEMRRMYDALLAKYHELASRQPHLVTAPALSDVEMPEPDVPPSVVLAAMKQISPIEDATYRANWAYWEKNKERAAAHPDAFADEILKGEEH